MGGTDRMGGTGRIGNALVLVPRLLLFSSVILPAPRPAFPAPPALPAASQVPFDQTIQNLTNADPGVRLRAAQMLKDAAYVESAVPLAAVVTDSDDAVQLEAIAAEVNIFLADKIVPRKGLALIFDRRGSSVAGAAFFSGPLAIGSHAVPSDVLVALRRASRDDNPRVAVEALYAFGTLAIEPGGAERRQLLAASSAELAPLVGAADPAIRNAAVRVIGRVYEQRFGDDPADQTVGDALITALNDKETSVKIGAAQALGAMRYERGVQALTHLFQYYGKGEMAAATLDALARIAHPSSVPLFVAQLSAKNSAIRGIAVEGIARAGDRSKLADIQAALAADRSDAVQLTGAFASARLSDGPIDSIVEALTRSRVRDQARQYLVELASTRAAILNRYAQDPDARIRADIADAIGLAANPALLPIAEALAKDQDAQVARAGERAAARLRRNGTRGV
jgi:HEAT repeat protein